jgi:hypothetical protein
MAEHGNVAPRSTQSRLIANLKALLTGKLVASIRIDSPRLFLGVNG